MKFHKNALQYINKVYLAGILDLIALDEIIDQASCECEDKVSLEIIKELTLITLLARRSDEENNIIENEELFQ